MNLVQPNSITNSNTDAGNGSEHRKTIAKGDEAGKQPNAYEQKQEERALRLLEKSAKLNAESLATFQKSRAATAGIVFGQPILVGHHSERRHRAAIQKSWDALGKGVALSEKAEHYAQKAASVGTGGISSDDPEAVKKLREKLAGLEGLQERMKAVNKVIRQRAGDEDEQINGLLALGWVTNDQAANLVKPDFAGRVGYPAYALQNNNANISSTKTRIESLLKLATRETVTQTGNGYEYREDTEENRICFVFEGKPAEAIRDILKAHAFKWSPTRGAWVRQITNNALYAAKLVKAKLNEAAA